MKLAILLCVVVVDIFFATLVFKSDSRNKTNIFFSLFIALGSIWALGDALMLFSASHIVAISGLYMFMVVPLFISLSILYFAYYFSKDVHQPASKTALTLASVPTLIFAGILSLQMDRFVDLDNVVISSQQNIFVPSQLYFLYSLYFVVYFFAYCGVLLKKYLNSKGLEKKRAFNVFWAISIATTLAFFTNLLIPTVFIDMSHVWVGPLSAMVIAILLTRAIVRYQLFDIRSFVIRSFAYILSVVAIGFLYAFAVFGLGALILPQSDISNYERIFYVFFALFVAITFTTVRGFFNRLSNRLFYQDSYDPQEFINALNQTLVSTIDLRKLLDGSAQVINNNLKSEFCIFAIRSSKTENLRVIGASISRFNHDALRLSKVVSKSLPHQLIVADMLEATHPVIHSEMKKNNISIIIQLSDSVSDNPGGLGYILIGPKKSGYSYNLQDIRILKIIANEIVVATQNALRFEEIQKFNLTLQEKVKRATKQLEERNRRLVLLDQTKDDFISMASHQLRTPLTSVKGYLSMTLEGDAGPLNDKQKELLNQAFVSSERMVYLISDMLNVSRLKTGKFVIEPSLTNLSELVDSEIKQLQGTAKARGLELVYKKPKEFPELMLDETKLRQVIMNFADNAIYYTPRGGKITVSLEDTGKTIEFTITDTGIGVPKDERHQLFTKFYRAKNAKKARPDGTGLGLYMAKKIIVAQGGSIIFHSKEGKGSTFGFTFPKAKLKPAPQKQSVNVPRD